jgi:hypothetical protein
MLPSARGFDPPQSNAAILTSVFSNLEVCRREFLMNMYSEVTTHTQQESGVNLKILGESKDDFKK